jgi:hypothetical protein
MERMRKYSARRGTGAVLCCVRREQRRAGQGSPRCAVLLSDGA